jgi:hypothetical protein
MASHEIRLELAYKSIGVICMPLFEIENSFLPVECRNKKK